MRDKLLQIQCKKFADEGIQFSQELHSQNSEVFNNYQEIYDYFSITLAIALTWTKHAQNVKGFFNYAISFFVSENDLDFNEIRKYKYRFGEEALTDAMNGLRQYKNHITEIIPDFQTCDAKDLKKFQDKSLTILNNLIRKGTVKGVGPWLFLGPMKIILGDKVRLWDDTNIDSIILPTGIEVNRGIRKLIKQNSPIVRNFDPNWIINEEKSLLEGYTNDQLVHNVLKKIAEIASTRVIHINSAFYLYGKVG